MENLCKSVREHSPLSSALDVINNNDANSLRELVTMQKVYTPGTSYKNLSSDRGYREIRYTTIFRRAAWIQLNHVEDVDPSSVLIAFVNLLPEED